MLGMKWEESGIPERLLDTSFPLCKMKYIVMDSSMRRTCANKFYDKWKDETDRGLW